MIEILIEYRGAMIAILVSLIGIMGAFALQRYLAIRNAVNIYKSAFAPELSAISNGVFAMDTFSGAFDRHKDAIDTVRPILPKSYQRKLQKAWDEYCGKDSGLGMDEKGFVSATSSMVYFNKEEFNNFKKRFNNLHSCLNQLT